MKREICYKKYLIIPEWLEEEVGGNRLLARILLQRGLDTADKVREFLQPGYYQATEFSAFPQIEEALAMVLAALEKGARICIYGDYDVDGVISTVILVELIRKLGGDVIYHIPDRFTEGYGMNKEVIRGLAGEVDLIITCDCGISNYEEVKLAKELGLKVIITDHHNLPDRLPPADTILTAKLLDSQHKAYNLPGAGIAYFLALAILDKLGREDLQEGFLELLVLAIVADVVPLQGENRYLLQKGLPLLPGTRRCGLKELYRIAGIDKLDNITEEEIAFGLAPLINSAGRIKKADLAVELFLTDDEARAKELALELDEANKRRKELQEDLIKEAREMLSPYQAGEAIVLYQPHWHEGVIGIAAGRLSEDYQVPVLLMCQKEGEKIITGSARSIPGVHIYKALRETGLYLKKYGGHAGAAGFSLDLDQLINFRREIKKSLTAELVKVERRIAVDGELSLDQISLEDYYALRKLAPFGEGNPAPKFVSYSTEVLYSRPTTGKRHLRLLLAQNGVQYPAIWWWAGEKEIPPVVDLVYSPGINDFQGKRELQLLVEEIISSTRDAHLEIPEKRPEIVAESRGQELEIIDLRDWEGEGRDFPDFPDAVYYYEGLEKIQGKEVINRYQRSSFRTLVLLSCPPSLAIFKELIYANRPARLVLAYNKGDLNNASTFIKKLRSLIKYAANKKGGQLDLYQIAAKTGEMEESIAAGLSYLAARGLITLNSFNPAYYIVRLNQKPQEDNYRVQERRLLNLLRETFSFKQYLLEVDPESIKTIFAKVI
ncbi:MAG TPA: single-stranded-DNA-specific exonuclease RecJ [Halanaerobiales bacterium]|nr:single-stranded-DNA-specific exonuclease RecJ [Halanaerobiales bacterium]HPZ62168.1 single-stranded-DNA-specific exonuclease RecJ [Halanaerobiales bacterium]HQD03840.1 single-stranded-DNA-specific exonuclease RecJ [Halanaerobiales bacterium]